MKATVKKQVVESITGVTLELTLGEAKKLRELCGSMTNAKIVQHFFIPYDVADSHFDLYQALNAVIPE